MLGVPDDDRVVDTSRVEDTLCEEGEEEDDKIAVNEAEAEEGDMTVLPTGMRLVDTTVLPAGHDDIPGKQDVVVKTCVENEVVVTGNVMIEEDEEERDETNEVLTLGDTAGEEVVLEMGEEDEIMLDVAEDDEKTTTVLVRLDEEVVGTNVLVTVNVEVAETTVLPIGTRLVDTTVLPAGQFVTSAEQEVTVNTSVEKRVTVT